MDLIGGDWVEIRILEGFLKMSNGGLCRALGTAAYDGLLGRRTNRCQCRANGRLRLKKPFPNSVDSRVTHRAAKLLKSLKFIAGCCGLVKKSPKAICIEKELFYFIGDPHTECSAAAFVAAAITAEDAESSDRFLSEILLVVSSEESVSIKSPGLLTVRTRRAFEQSKPPVPLLLRSENPYRQNDARIPCSNEICRPICKQHKSKRAG